jgi:hypothetical protein
MGIAEGFCTGVRSRISAPTHLVPVDVALHAAAGANDAVFVSRKGCHLTERAVNGMVKRMVRKAGINEAISPHRAAARARLTCHRPRRLAARGAGDAGPRQYRHHIRVPARPTQHVEQLAPGSGSISSMRTGAIITSRRLPVWQGQADQKGAGFSLWLTAVRDPIQTYRLG